MKRLKRRIGKTEFQVFPIGLGAMPLSVDGRPDREHGRQVVRDAVAAGCDFIDTANSYCLDETDKGHNEQLIREALSSIKTTRRVVVATKVGCTRLKGGWQMDCRPESIRKACDKSLKDLGIKQFDLYYLHAEDSNVPLEESMGSLKDLQAEGKIKHLGVSNFDQGQLERALKVIRVEAVQNRQHLFKQNDFKSGLVEFCAQEQIAYVAHSPVGGHHQHTEANQVSELKDMAKKYNTSTYCIMLHWLLRQSENVFAIPGASKSSSILDSFKALDFEMLDEDLGRFSG
ncbi:MAG: aldo/keto reductase [Deltaproteobacteria bacterium CG11_big_fil_rev_8_21_14_0_20_45_16]|nr:MAG: aldo/keto reductase [Deltaproteobacteria bacterium CG11_big_fil_rev_8_21_14_0_20_45_16]